MLRNLLVLLSVFCGALLLVGVTFSGVREGRADFVILNGSEPKTLDPHKMTGVLEGRVADALHEGLTYRDNDTLEPRPGCAAAWTVSADGLRYEFRMRPEARWTDGTRVTARDFVYSWRRLQEPEIASEYAYLLHGIRHAEAYNTYGAQVEALKGKPGAEDEKAAQGIVAGLRALVAASPLGLDAADWQAFGDAWKVWDAVIRTEESVLREALDRREGRFAPDEARALADAMAADAARRESALEAAQAHFGVDEGIWAPDDDTFVVELRAPIPYFLDLTSFHASLPVQQRAVERDPEAWFLPGRHVGNGAFRLESWTVNRSLRVRRSETYWGRAEVSLETVDFLPAENATTSLNLYLTGAADWLPGNYPPDLVEVLRERPDFQATPSTSTYFYRVNVTRKPFDDARVRLALSRAIDRDLIVAQVTRKHEPVAVRVVPPMEGYDPPESRMGHDPAAARALLAEAGFPGGRGFPKFGLLYNTSEGHKKIAEAVVDQWRRVLGVDATAYNAEWQAYLSKQTKLDYEVCRAAWVADYVDPNTFLDMWVTKGGNNNTGWSSGRYDRLVALAADPTALLAGGDDLLERLKEPREARALLEAMRTGTAEERTRAALALRMRLFREAEAILVQDAFPVIPVYYYVNTGLITPRAENFRRERVFPDGRRAPNWMDLHPLRDLRVRKEAP